MSQPTNSYDEMPYHGQSFAYTYPDSLATVARLHGIDAPDVHHCRVLELGCAEGGNLIPMAMELPRSSFLGVDLSARQIEEGCATVEALGLRNIDLRAMDINDLKDQPGEFDYIVCHGVFSWVPESVRDTILSICGARLSPRGIAFISYNTYPGWHARGMVREMMAYHVRELSVAADRVVLAREFLEGLVESMPHKRSPYAHIIRSESEMLREVKDSYLYHEHLEEVNHPFYFHEFMRLATRKGLRFVAEARTSGLLDSLPEEARSLIDQWSPDDLAAEQYIDFFCNRTFRKTLLCRAELEPTRSPRLEVVPTLSVMTTVAPTTMPVDVRSDQPQEFRKTGTDKSVTTNNPLIKAALATLHDVHPGAIAFDTLSARIQARLGRTWTEMQADRDRLAAALLQCFQAELIDFHVHPPVFASEVSAFPIASPLVRLQIKSSDRVTNLCRRVVVLDDFGRQTLALLDGTRDRAAVVEGLLDLIASGALTITHDGASVVDRDVIRGVLEDAIGPCLERLARMAMLVS